LPGPFHIYSNDTSFVPALFQVPRQQSRGIELPGRRLGYRVSPRERPKDITNH
jgi:hypothetical protein